MTALGMAFVAIGGVAVSVVPLGLGTLVGATSVGLGSIVGFRALRSTNIYRDADRER